MKEKLLIGLIILSGMIWLLGGCESGGQTGALVGSGVGAGVGALVGDSTEDTLTAAAIGGGVGYIFGSEQDKKEAATERGQLRQEMNVVTVNITNSNGSVVPVRLVRQGAVFIGPRGETYSTLPTPEQLKMVYGF